MALGAGFFAVWPLAELFVTAHALFVIGVHGTWNQLLRWLVMADCTIGKQRVKLYNPLLWHRVAKGFQDVALGAALFPAYKNIFVTGYTAGMDGIGQIGRCSRFSLVARGRSRFMTVCAALRFRLNAGIFMVTIRAFKPQFGLMPFVSPFLGCCFVMMAGNA